MAYREAQAAISRREEVRDASRRAAYSVTRALGEVDIAWEERIRRAYGALRATDRRTAPSSEELTTAEASEAALGAEEDSGEPIKVGILPKYRR